MTQVTVELLNDLARRAGAITLEHFMTELSVETKADESPVTIADRRTEQFLRDEILRLFPADGIVGEEFGETEGTAGRGSSIRSTAPSRSSTACRSTAR